MNDTILNVTLLQQDLFWENSEANLSKFSLLLKSFGKKTDILVLPEMFSTGFSMKTWAQKANAAVCGSLMIAENGHYFNRFIWVEPDGNLRYYNKAHLFRMGEEQLHYTRGKERIIIDYKGWKIAPFVCYDLRFPVWMRRTPDYNYDMILLVANWPERRSLHWNTLLAARAIENQSYVIAVNRVGADGNGVNHAGDSQVIKPNGELSWKETGGRETMQAVDLHLDEVRQYRKSFPVDMDADKFDYTN